MSYVACCYELKPTMKESSALEYALRRLLGGTSAENVEEEHLELWLWNVHKLKSSLYL
jgi:hypothetical protein